MSNKKLPQNIQSSTPKEAYSLLNTYLQRISKLEAQNETLRQRPMEPKLSQKMRHQSEQDTAGLRKKIQELEKQLIQGKQKNRLDMQNEKNKMISDFQARLKQARERIQNDEINKLKQIIKAKDEKIDIIQKELVKMKKDKINSDSKSIDGNEMTITTNLLDQSKKEIASISQQYRSVLKSTKQEISNMKSANQKALRQYDQLNKRIKVQDQRIKQEQQKQIQKIKSSEKVTSFLAQISTKLGDLQKMVQTQQMKTVGNKYLMLLKNSKQPGIFTTQKQNQLKTLSQQILIEVRRYITDLKNQKDESSKKNKDLQIKSEKQINKINSDLKKVEDSAKDLQAKLQAKSSQLEGKVKQLQNLRNQSQILLAQKQSQKKKTTAQFTAKLAQKDNKIASLEKLITQKEGKITILDQKKSLLESQIQKLIKQNKTKDQKISELEGFKRELQITKATLTKFKEDATAQLTKLRKQLQTAKTRIVMLQKQNVQLKSEVASLKLILKRTQDQSKIEIQRINKQLSDLKLKHNQLIAILTILKSENEKLRITLAKARRDYEDTMVRLQDCQSTVRQLRSYQQLYNQMSDMLNELTYYIARQKIQMNKQNSIQTAFTKLKKFYNQVKYFGGSLAIQKEQVTFVIEAIGKLTQRTIEQCSLVYRYDPKNIVNFHQYIDGKQNLIVLVRLSNNYVVGGYSALPVQKMQKEKAKQAGLGLGILFSVTNRLTFKMKKDPKMPVVSYDDFFFIFGNSEIRLKTQERKLFSNFAVAASTFDSLGEQKAAFMGQNISETEVITYQFYQAKFR